MVACGKMFRSAFTRVPTSLALAFIVTSLLAACFTASAFASSDAVYKACANGGSLDGFSKSDLQSALGGVPTDLDEYYGCSALINAALLNKATKGSSGGTSKTGGVKGGKAAIKAASVNDLTTKKQRKELRDKVEEESDLKAGDPVDTATSPDITEAAGKTLASSAAPSIPTALIIAVIGLLLLIAVDLAGRLGKMPRVKSLLPKNRDGAGS